MLLFDGIIGVVAFGLWLYCVIDVLTTQREQVRNLPKLGWLAIVVLFAALGALAWLVFGRPWNREPALVGTPRRPRATSPDDDDDFLAALDARMRKERRNGDDHPGERPGA